MKKSKINLEKGYVLVYNIVDSLKRYIRHLAKLKYHIQKTENMVFL